MLKRLPTMRETQVRSLGQEDPLEKEMATHFSILAWKIPYCLWGHKESDTTERLSFLSFPFLPHSLLQTQHSALGRLVSIPLHTPCCSSQSPHCSFPSSCLNGWFEPTISSPWRLSPCPTVCGAPFIFPCSEHLCVL